MPIKMNFFKRFIMRKRSINNHVILDDFGSTDCLGILAPVNYGFADDVFPLLVSTYLVKEYYRRSLDFDPMTPVKVLPSSLMQFCDSHNYPHHVYQHVLQVFSDLGVLFINSKPKRSFRTRLILGTIRVLLCSFTIMILPTLGHLGNLFRKPKPAKLKARRQAIPMQLESKGTTLTQDISAFLIPLLETYALPIAYVMSLASSLVTSIALVKAYSTRNKHPRNADTNRFTLVAMVSSFINLVSTAILGIAGACTAEFPWQQAVTAVTEDIEATIEEINDPKPCGHKPYNAKHAEFLASCKQLITSVKHEPKQFRRIVSMCYEDKYNTTNFLLPTINSPFFRMGGMLRNPLGKSGLVRVQELFAHWPTWFVAAWYDLEEQELIPLRNVTKHLNHVTRDSTSEDDKTENEYNSQLDKIPMQNEDFTTGIKAIYDVMFSKVIALFLGILSCLITKKPVTPDVITESLARSDKVQNIGNDFKDAWALFNGEETCLQKNLSLGNSFVEDLSKYMEMSTFQFAANRMRLERFKKRIEEAERFFNSLDIKSRTQFPMLQGLLVAATTKKNELITSQLPSLQRQEPFLVLIRGDSGVGKTQLAMDLAKYCADELIRGDFAENYVQINPNDKYWPPLSGQTIAFFDDAATKRDLDMDLLFANMKGLCSPANYNAAAAAISHKVNPVNFKVMIATCNPEFNEIATRVTAKSDSVTWLAQCRRGIIIEMKFKDEKYAQGLSKEQTIDMKKSGFYKKNYSHANLTLYTVQKGSLQPDRAVSAHEIKRLIANAYDFHAQEFRELMAKLYPCEEQAAKPGIGKTHFSVCIHGRTGQGKSLTLSQQLNSLALALHYPVVYLPTEHAIRNLPKQTKRCIAVLDDTIKEGVTPSLEDAVMDLYNNKLAQASVIINATNISPKFRSVRWNLCEFLVDCKLPFSLEGVARRIGFTELVNGTRLPQSNLELYVQNFRFFRVLGSSAYSCWILALLLPYILVLFPSYHAFLFLTLYSIGVYAYISRHPYHIAEEYTQNRIPGLVYEQYQEFLNLIKDVKVVHGNFTKPQGCNFELQAESPECVHITSNPLEMEKHLFYNRDRFEACTLPWKIFISHDIFETLMRNVDKLMIETSVLDYDTILGIVKRYAIAFKELGVEPHFYVNIRGCGSFLFQDDVVTANIVTPEQAPIVLHTPDGLQVGYQEAGEWVVIPCTSLLFNPEHAFDDKKISISGAIAIREFVSSSRFVNHPSVKQQMKSWVSEQRKLSLAVKAKRAAETLRTVRDHPLGKACMVLFTVWVAIKTIVALKERFCSTNSVVEEKRPKGSKKGNIKVGKGTDADKKKKQAEIVDTSSDCDSEPEQQKRPKGSKKNKPRIGQGTDLDKRQRENVYTLTDMNNYNAYKNHIGSAHSKATRNLCQIYMSQEIDDVIYAEPSGSQLCYGLLIGDDMLVTVGHVCDSMEGVSMYAFMDEFNEADGRKRGVRLTLLHRYPTRDISVWILNYDKNVSYKAKEIKNLFMSRKFLNDNDILNGVIQRYGVGKKEEFHGGEISIMRGPDTFGSKPVTDYGQMMFGTFSLKLTNFGDCGLPYYACEPQVAENKIFGIHCMGNVEGYTSCGMLSIIYSEDFAIWKQMKADYISRIKKLSTQSMACCPMAVTGFVTKPDDAPKAPGHKTIWNPCHQSSLSALVNELSYFFTTLPGVQQGMLIKNSGTLKGSIEHSHLQFIPDKYHTLDPACGWKKTTAGELNIKNGMHADTELHFRIVSVPLNSLLDHVSGQKLWGDDFRFHCNIVQCPRTSQMIATYAIITASPIPTTEFNKEMCMSTLSQLPFGNQVYATNDICELVLRAASEKERGVLEDMPYRHIPDNETVKVIGAFRTNKSHTPSNCFKQTPFAAEIRKKYPELETKYPFCSNIDDMPIEIIDKLTTDNYGEKSQLATQSIKWAHRMAKPDPGFIKSVSEEFYYKINRYYSNMRIMTNRETLQGCSEFDQPKDAPYFKGIELNKSVGYTMKELFFVQKKGDVLSVDEQGTYHWNDNPASTWLQEQWKIASEQVRRGNQYFVAFNELLKMEKLKESKRFLGRTFCAQDFLGTLLERQFFGDFAIRAMRDDPTCGIGTDPMKDFNAIYQKMNKHPNIFAADYKNFDRNTPAKVQSEIKDLLKRANPHMAGAIEAILMNLILRFQVTGRTLAQVFGGMASGSYFTAPFNSVSNEYLIFSTFADICETFDLPWSWQLFDDNVEREYYGDDVYISVSDRYAPYFNRESVAESLMRIWGMEIDSSSKDGTVAKFDTWENGSWISRYFRKLDKYPFVVGALKKISINSQLFYTTSLDPEHLASILEITLQEAAMWEPEYFDTINACVRIAIERVPKLSKLILLKDRQTVQAAVMRAALPTICTRLSSDVGDLKLEPSRPLDLGVPVSKVIRHNSRRHSNQYFKHIVQRILNNENATFEDLINEEMSNVCTLNNIFQSGYIAKPLYSYEPVSAKKFQWKCTLLLWDVPYYGYGNSKAEAAEGAAYVALENLYIGKGKVVPRVKPTNYIPVTPLGDPIEQTARRPPTPIDANCMRYEMNVSAGVVNKVPSAPMMASDASVVVDSGLYTNTQAPTVARIINSSGIALDNPAGTGAPFNKHVSCYQIFQRWEAKNTVISPALPTGSEILRLSLDPSTLPQMLRSYIDFHQSWIPALEIVIAIAGAQGSIGWLSTGWVKDASSTKKYTLQDLQQVSMEETNMNGTQIIKILLTDIRKSGLYRNTDGETEPYPGIIMMVDYPVTNVQRNDGVNYPVRVQVRLHQSCILMEPFNLPSGNNARTTFDLGSYFYDDNVDAIIGSSAVANDAESIVTFPDDGFMTHDFVPTFDSRLLAVVFNTLTSSTDTAVAVISPTASITADYLAQIEALDKIPGNTNSNLFPSKLIFAYGNVSPLDDFYYSNAEPTILGSVYALSGTVKCGIFTYNLSTLIVQSQGCYIVAAAPITIQASAKHGQLAIYNNCSDVDFTQSAIDTFVGYDQMKLDNGDVISQDHTHNNVAVGDSYQFPYPVAGATKVELLATTLLGNWPKTFVQTGNSMPSTALPTGLKQLSFVRSGTVTRVAEDLPFVPLYKPILRNAYRAFDEFLTTNGFSNLVKGTLVINGTVRGEVGYQNSTLFVRTDDFKKIIPSTTTDVKITDIADLTTPAGLASFNTTGMNSWISSNIVRTKRRINLCYFQYESAIAGGLISGLGSGITDWSKQLFQQEMQDRLLRSNQAIAGANNAALAERQRMAFQRNLELSGAQGASAQFGQQHGPQTEDQMNTRPYQRMNNFVYSHTFVPSGTAQPGRITSQEADNDSDDDGLPSHQTITTTAQVHAPADDATTGPPPGIKPFGNVVEKVPPPKPETTAFTNNPIFVPPTANQVGAANHDAAPLDIALTKTLAQNVPSAAHFSAIPTS